MFRFHALAALFSVDDQYVVRSARNFLVLSRSLGGLAACGPF